MRLLAIALCFMLSACIGPAMRPSVNDNSLYNRSGYGVNLGNKPQISEMREIRGAVYIY